MRKLIYLISLLLFCSACSDDKSQERLDPPWLTAIRELFVGSWHGELCSEALEITECEDLLFTPFAERVNVVSQFGTFDADGMVLVEGYYGDHLLQTSKRCLYTIVGYRGEEYLVSFYPCNDENEVTGGEEKRIVIPESATLFYMRKYGLSEQNNKRYEKQ